MPIMWREIFDCTLSLIIFCSLIYTLEYTIVRIDILYSHPDIERIGLRYENLRLFKAALDSTRMLVNLLKGSTLVIAVLAMALVSYVPWGRQHVQRPSPPVQLNLTPTAPGHPSLTGPLLTDVHEEEEEEEEEVIEPAGLGAVEGILDDDQTEHKTGMQFWKKWGWKGGE